MIESILTNLIAPVLVAIVTWVLARKKNEAEASTTELENVEKAITIWKNIAIDMQAQLTAANDKITALQELVEQLRSEIKK